MFHSFECSLMERRGLGGEVVGARSSILDSDCMESAGGEVVGARSSILDSDCMESADGDADNALFSSSQYAFFGKDVLEEVELGGLEDGDEGIVGLEDEEYHFSSIGDREEGEVLGFSSDTDDITTTFSKVEVSGFSSDTDDITTTFSKLNRLVTGSKTPGVIGDRGSCSREGSAVTDLTQEAELPNWPDQRILDTEDVQESKQRWLQSHASSVWHGESKPLYRTSSYPWQPQQHSSEPTHILADPKSLYRTASYPQQPQQHSSEPIFVPQSSLTSYPLQPQQHSSEPIFLPQSSLTSYPLQPQQHSSEPIFVPQSSLTSYPPPSGLSQVSSHYTSIPSFTSGLPQHLTGLPSSLHYGGNVAQFTPSNLSVNGRNHWSNQGNLFSGENPSRLHQELPYPNGLSPSQLFSLQQQQLIHQLQPSLSHFSCSHASPQKIMNKFDPILEIAEVRSQRLRSSQRGRPNMRFPQQDSDSSRPKNDTELPQFRSKYMSADEIEVISRMQNAATQSNDPYIHDYYHQACLAKKSTELSPRIHFYPAFIKDLPSRACVNNEPHVYLQVDALGRLPFSSIRKPHPLLEVNVEQISSVKPLEEEPLLTARIMIEDGLRALLDVDDIDRLLHANHLQDGGSQLRRRRQMLLEGLAASLQLVDPLGSSKSGNSVGLSPNDDLLFLRVVSLPKGRKLVSRFVKLLLPGSELSRIVCMGIFRHLRFLFGVLPSDSCAAETITNLAKTVSFCVSSMELNALSACLAAVVCSSEQPPLRPLGSSAGDGASVVIKSVLEKATELFTNPHAASKYNMPNRALWQASFDSFFGLLKNYCLSKYDTIFQKLLIEAPTAAVIGSEAARVVRKEMPVELLRASLPHTDEHQRKTLLDFCSEIYAGYCV